jgi:hypothetical protein
MDQWGMPLPISSQQQDYIDRVFAVLADPTRCKALLHSGQLCPDEVEPLATVYPEIYETIVEDAMGDMRAAKPPFPAWAEGVLGILFQKPAATVYNPSSEANGKPPGGKMDKQAGTPADRRELAVRESAA